MLVHHMSVFFLLVAGELVTGEQLAWFVKAEAATAGSEDTSHIVDQLERLHVTLQVVVALRTYLNLSLISLTHLTAQVSEACGGCT